MNVASFVQFAINWTIFRSDSTCASYLNCSSIDSSHAEHFQYIGKYAFYLVFSQCVFCYFSWILTSNMHVCQQGSSQYPVAASHPTTKGLNIEYIEMNPLNMIVRNVRISISIFISQWVCKWIGRHTFIHLNCNKRAFKMWFKAISNPVWYIYTIYIFVYITDLRRIRRRFFLLSIFILNITHTSFT